jgi:hypothetical protein
VAAFWSAVSNHRFCVFFGKRNAKAVIPHRISNRQPPYRVPLIANFRGPFHETTAPCRYLLFAQRAIALGSGVTQAEARPHLPGFAAQGESKTQGTVSRQRGGQ